MITSVSMVICSSCFGCSALRDVNLDCEVLSGRATVLVIVLLTHSR